MLQIKKIALLATAIALASAPTAASALSLPPGPVSVVTTCANTGEDIIVLGQTQTFDLTDITITDPGPFEASVSINNTHGNGVEYFILSPSQGNPNPNITQKFETPIRFAGPANSPFLTCENENQHVIISIQGVMH
jgi:hypothetical protein